MSEDAEKLRQEHLDKYYPFIAQGAPHPGEWVTRQDGSRHWIEKPGWRTQHGPAIVQWNSGRPVHVINARLPDGSRGDVSEKLDFGWRRRAEGAKRFVWGAVEIKPDDVVFSDGEQPTYKLRPQTETPDLEADLARDTDFLSWLRTDDRHGMVVYVVFRNRDFLKGADDRRWSCGDRQAARIARDLRGMGESYQDFYPWGELKGTWPPDRVAVEKDIRKRIAEAEKPIELPSFETAWKQIEDMQKLHKELHPNGEEISSEVREQQKAHFRQQVEENAARLAEKRPELEADRLQRLQKARESLAKFERNENEDVFEELFAHLSRLGWRTESEDDREATGRRSLARAVEVLRQVKVLEGRPEAATPEWAQVHAKSLSARGGDVRLFNPEPLRQMSAEEREAVYPVSVGVRLLKLAVTGRISKVEFERLNALLTGRQEALVGGSDAASSQQR